MKIRSAGLAATATLALILGLCGCSTHAKPITASSPRAKACLIEAKDNAGNALREQIATDLVQAKVQHGIAVREIAIARSSSNQVIQARLLTALTSGCVFMVSVVPEFSAPLASFVGKHSTMAALQFGGALTQSAQPKNLRFVQDSLTDPSYLAGFVAAAESKMHKIAILTSANFSTSAEIIASFKAGVRKYSQQFGDEAQISVSPAGTDLGASIIAATKAGADVIVPMVAARHLNVLRGVEGDQIKFITVGARWLTASSNTKDVRVIASIERNSQSTFGLSIKDFLTHTFDQPDLARNAGDLASGAVELRLGETPALSGATLSRLETLITAMKANENPATDKTMNQ